MKNLTKELQERNREEFIKKYCVKRPAQEIRWIRSVFYDDKDQIETILCEMERDTAQTVQTTLERVKEIVEGVDGYELDGYPEEGYYMEKCEDGEYIRKDDIIKKLDI